MEAAGNVVPHAELLMYMVSLFGVEF